MINIQNFDNNEFFKWCLVRYLNLADNHPARIRKINKLFGDELDYENINFPVKIKDIHKIETKNSIGISVFGYEHKEKYPIYVSKKCFEDKDVDLLLIKEKKTKRTTFLSRISILSCLIIYFKSLKKTFLSLFFASF